MDGTDPFADEELIGMNEDPIPLRNISNTRQQQEIPTTITIDYYDGATWLEMSQALAQRQGLMLRTILTLKKKEWPSRQKRIGNRSFHPQSPREDSRRRTTTKPNVSLGDLEIIPYEFFGPHQPLAFSTSPCTNVWGQVTTTGRRTIPIENSYFVKTRENFQKDGEWIDDPFEYWCHAVCIAGPRSWFDVPKVVEILMKMNAYGQPSSSVPYRNVMGELVKAYNNIMIDYTEEQKSSLDDLPEFSWDYWRNRSHQRSN
ncbi:hypothetical protein F5Y00DRAFT_258138 [Daldinia vernicosa]|uniref:uncharacterized protein n=1 Tax=Daldinia vernicosa TaxID=114800 RepID=UPI00200887F3|nr:uncharacterized protein F5Y00DRAFT_258138 [Daldinia vernicosa]KAI0852883.1 hypothetical protein F5Y00DRAFT_258138 [Daldinia vernicosa]